MTEARKIFPLRLPPNFHGKVKDQQRLAMLHRLKVIGQQNPEIGNIKNSSWQRKRLDIDVIEQRRQMVVHTGKISSDTPEWFQTTCNFYRRNQAPKYIRPSASQDKRYDVFNRQRTNPLSLSSQTTGTRSQFHDRRLSITQKIGSRNMQGMTASGFWRNNQREVSAKVGSLENRNFNVRKPLLKVGQLGFIDTYSVV